MGMKFKSLACHLEPLSDPRQVRGRRHVLLNIFVIAVLAALCGVDDAWVRGIRGKIPGDVVALDGKRLRAFSAFVRPCPGIVDRPLTFAASNPPDAPSLPAWSALVVILHFD